MANTNVTVQAPFQIEKLQITPSHQDEDSITPLHLASQSGTLETVRFLTDEKHCDPLCRNKSGTSLHSAALGGRLDVLKFFISEKHCDPMYRNKSGNTPLHWAALGGRLDVLKFLISEKHCDPMCKGQFGRTPLHEASEKGHLNVVKYLTEQQVNPTCQDENGTTPLHLASQFGTLETVRFLTDEKHCDPLCKNKLGYTPVQLAALGGRLDVLKFFISEKRCDPMCKGKFSRTPLHHASEKGHLDVVKYLTDEQQVNPSCQDDYGTTPLHLASYVGTLETVRFLTDEKHCDPMCKDWSGRTPLHNASEKGHLDVVKYLTDEQQVNPSCQDEKGTTPLHLASQFGTLETVRFLTDEKHCDPLCRDKSGNTPLHWAAEGGRLDVLKFLIGEKHFNLAYKGWLGRTPLHSASQAGHIDVVRYLTDEQQVNPSCQGTNGTTPLHVASKLGSLEVVRFLTDEKHCDPMNKNKSGSTALHYAAHGGKVDILKFFINEKHCDPECKGQFGGTPIEFSSEKGHLDVVKYLISEVNVDPGSALKLAVDNDHVPTARYLMSKGLMFDWSFILSLTSKFQSLVPMVNICVVGNAGSGKSTLVKALQAAGSLSGWMFGVQGVDPKTAGIVPSEFSSRKLGKVTFYDFAGDEEYYAGHEALLEGSSCTVFLVVLNLNSSPEMMKSALYYWELLLANAVSTAGCQARVIAVGSHADQLDKHALSSKTATLSEIMESPSPFKVLQHVGYVTLDCRVASSNGISKLQSLLQKICKHIRFETNFDYQNGALLNDIIHQHLPGVTACTFSDLLNRFGEVKDADLAQSFKSSDSLLAACTSLNTSGHLIFMKDELMPKHSWIVLDKVAILSEVHGLLKHLKVPTGMVPFSLLRDIIAEHCKDLRLELVLQYMLRMEFCSKIDPQALSLIPGFDQDCLQDHYYFFPSLISTERPSDVWAQNTGFAHAFGWCLKCADPYQFFTPRFLQVLLIHLAALAHNSTPAISTELTPGCRIWKNGIRWLSPHGIETIVEVSDQSKNVTAVMRCLEESDTKFIKQRSSVIKQILRMQKFCSEVKPKEFIIHPHCLRHYPLQASAEIPMTQVTETIVEKHPYLIVDDHTLPDTPEHPFLPLDKVVLFEPYQNLGRELLEKLFNPLHCASTERVPEETLDNIARAHLTKWKALSEVLDVPPELTLEVDSSTSDLQKCMDILTAWSQRDGTFAALRHDMGQYSIFAGRNPLVSLWLLQLATLNYTLSMQCFPKYDGGGGGGGGGIWPHQRTECIPITTSRDLVKGRKHLGSRYPPLGEGNTAVMGRYTLCVVIYIAGSPSPQSKCTYAEN